MAAKIRTFESFKVDILTTIYGKRKTTIAHALLLLCRAPTRMVRKRIDAALRTVGQDPYKDLQCVYCDRPAETWDHMMAVV